MDAKKFLEEARRLCEVHESCVECFFYEGRCLFGKMPMGWESKEIERVVPLVEQWSEEHPKKTRLQDFLEKYPNAPIGRDGTPYFMPWNLGYCGDTPCYACEKAEGKPTRWCWEQEVDEE